MNEWRNLNEEMRIHNLIFKKKVEGDRHTLDSLFNGLPWPAYIFLTLGSAIIMFILAIIAILRKKPVLMIIGITLMGFTGISLALVKYYDLLNLKWNEGVIRVIPVLFLISGIVISLVGVGIYLAP